MHGLVSLCLSQLLVHGLNESVFIQLSTSIGAWSERICGTCCPTRRHHPYQSQGNDYCR